MTSGGRSFSPVIRILIIGGLCFLAAWPFYGWIIQSQPPEVVKMDPGLDGSPEEVRILYDDDLLYPEAQLFSQMIPQWSGGDWPQFRGPDRNGIISDSPSLLFRDDSIPEKLWSVELGEGHAAPVVSQGRVYVLDYDESLSSDMLRCFSMDDGEELWSLSYDNPIKRNHGRSRSIPAVSGNVVLTVGPSGDVMAADRETGIFLWGFSMVRRYGGDVPLWYASQCPLVVDDVVYLVPGGDMQMAAYNIQSGELMWEIPNSRNWQMSHASLMVAEIDGQKHIVQSMIGGLAGISPEGEELWHYPWNPAVVAPSPIVIEENRIIQSAGYGVGTLILEIELVDDIWTVNPIDEYVPGQGLSTEQQTAVYHKERLWGVLPKDAGGLREQFVCAYPDGEILWSSGQDYRFGLGPWILADDKFFILSDDGVLTAADADPSGWSPLWSYKVLDGIDAWGPPAFSDGLILLRDSMSMSCYDLRIRSADG